MVQQLNSMLVIDQNVQKIPIKLLYSQYSSISQMLS